MPSPIKPYVDALIPYTPGEQPNDPSVIKLNTNENPYPPAPGVMETLRTLTPDRIRKYPPATADALRDAIGQRLGFDRDQIIIGYGSDEILRLLCHAVCGPDHPAASLNPSYSLYPVLGALYQGAVRFFDETPPATTAETATLPEDFVAAPCPLLFLPNPNPPYGTFYPLAAIDRLCRVRPERLVVVDEAYVDFAPESAIALLADHPNLVVTRTFSKSYSLAGMRVGFALGAPDVIAALMKLKDSYNLPIASQLAALAAWQDQNHFDQTRRQIIATRDRLAHELTARGFQVHPSQGNFVFARRPDAAKVFAALKQRAILTRYWSQPPLDGGIRISIGTDPEIDRLLEALDQMGQ